MDDPEFGYRLLTDELHLKGVTASENRVWRLCSQQRIFSVHSRKRGLNREPGPPVHDDLLERDFTAHTLNSKWLTDITEHPTAQGKLYLCAIKDCASNKIVGYSLDARMTSELAVTALRNAIALRSPEATIVHSDRGSQGGFNWSSQHLDHGGVRWDDQGSRCRRRRQGGDGSGQQIGRCGRRCARPGGLSRRELCSGSSGV